MRRVIVDNCAALNKGAMRDDRPAFAMLFDPRLVASVLGMFELNALGITVESPVEDLRDELHEDRRRAGGRRHAVGNEANGVDKRPVAANVAAALQLLRDFSTTDVPCDVRCMHPKLHGLLISAKGVQHLVRCAKHIRVSALAGCHTTQGLDPKPAPQAAVPADRIIASRWPQHCGRWTRRENCMPQLACRQRRRSLTTATHPKPTPRRVPLSTLSRAASTTRTRPTARARRPSTTATAPQR